MIKAITFDLDNVLVEMSDNHKIALNMALNTTCSYIIPDNLHYGKLNGLPTAKKLEYLVSEGYIPDNINLIELNSLKQRFTVDLIIANLKPDGKKQDMLGRLKEDGYLLGCVTNSIWYTTQLMLQTTGIFEYFDKVISNTDVKYPKPHSQGYQSIQQYFEVFPNQMLIVEDSPHGIKAAQDSGSYLLTVKNPDEVTYENIIDTIKGITP